MRVPPSLPPSPLPPSPLWLLALAAAAAAVLAGCQPPMLAARGSFVAFAPAPPPAPPPPPGLHVHARAAAHVQAPSAGAHAHVSVQISFFGIPLAGSQDVVFVLDRSGSMSGIAAGFAGEDVGMSKTGAVLAGLGATLVNAKAKALPSKMEAAKEELARTLAAMPDGTRFMIVFFDDAISAFSPRMLTLEPQTRAAAIAFVRGIKPGGSTAAVPALRLAYEAGAARVVLLSDGLANTGGGGDTLLAEARGVMRAGVRFDTVGLGIDQDSQLMTALAAESGGMAIKR
ncbi:MAG TPA: VWA domain-containing protein [Kofleriaceae bacterium]|nr:VWA domain-containing protein [Kofleriaceae bacterium]